MYIFLRKIMHNQERYTIFSFIKSKLNLNTLTVFKRDTKTYLHARIDMEG